jgi:hypothetical protein
MKSRQLLRSLLLLAAVITVAALAQRRHAGRADPPDPGAMGRDQVPSPEKQQAEPAINKLAVQARKLVAATRRAEA